MLPSSSRSLKHVALLLLSLSTYTQAFRLIESRSLSPCMTNSSFSATLFNVAFTPDNNTLSFDIIGVSNIDGNVTATLEVLAYGYKAIRKVLNPCEMKLKGMCPMTMGQFDLQSTQTIDASAIAQIPGIAYQIPDLDGVARVYVNRTDTKELVACVEAQLSNGKTVDQKAVAWVTAVIAGLGLVASAVTNGLGHSNTAAHVAANAMSLFGYFQAQAMIGMVAVKLPPVVLSWTQNFNWSMGIINIGFMQRVLNWYIQSTGGTPATLLDNLDIYSVQVAKRSLMPRSNNGNTINENQGSFVVSGIKRMSFKADIEKTNFFLTGLSFFVVFLVLVAGCVAAFKWICEGLIKWNKMNSNRFQEFRNGWLTVLKGILYRLVLIGFPQMTILCLWEFTQKDSAACIVLALFFFVSMATVLCWGAFKVIKKAKKSITMHKNPAYILYSDPKALNRWGFLYVQFKAPAYYFIVPLLIYIALKGLFIAFGQGSGLLQAVALIIIEVAYLAVVCYLKPWMDKRTNIFNIAICSINFLNVIFLLFFTNVFNAPGLVTGVMGVVFFVANALFALVLLILVLLSSCYALVSKNPDVRYQPMRDDRASFIKSNSQMVLSTELDALGATARGDFKGQPGKRSDLDDDDASISGSSLGRQQSAAAGVPLPQSSGNSHYAGSHYAPSYRDDQPPRSPVDPNMPYHSSGNTYDNSSSNSTAYAPSRDQYGGGQQYRERDTHSSHSNNNYAGSQRGYDDRGGYGGGYGGGGGYGQGGLRSQGTSPSRVQNRSPAPSHGGYNNQGYQSQPPSRGGGGQQGGMNWHQGVGY